MKCSPTVAYSLSDWKRMEFSSINQCLVQLRISREHFNTVRDGNCIEGLTRDEIIKRSIRSAGRNKRTINNKVEVESNKDERKKEWYYIKCCDGREMRNVTEIKNDITNEIIIPPIKIELKSIPITYKKDDEKCCMVLNKIQPMRLRELIGNVCNGLSAQNEFIYENNSYKDIRFSVEDDDCTRTDEDKDKGGDITTTIGPAFDNNDENGDGDDDKFSVSFANDGDATGTDEEDEDERSDCVEDGAEDACQEHDSGGNDEDFNSKPSAATVASIHPHKSVEGIDRHSSDENATKSPPKKPDPPRVFVDSNTPAYPNKCTPNFKGKKQRFEPERAEMQTVKVFGNPDSGINEDDSDYGGGKMSTSKVPLSGGCSPERKLARFGINHRFLSHFTAQDIDNASLSSANNGTKNENKGKRIETTSQNSSGCGDHGRDIDGSNEDNNADEDCSCGSDNENDQMKPRKLFAKASVSPSSSKRKVRLVSNDIEGYDADEDCSCGSDEEDDYVFDDRKEDQEQSTAASGSPYPWSSKAKVQFDLNHRSTSHLSAQEGDNDSQICINKGIEHKKKEDSIDTTGQDYSGHGDQGHSIEGNTEGYDADEESDFEEDNENKSPSKKKVRSEPTRSTSHISAQHDCHDSLVVDDTEHHADRINRNGENAPHHGEKHQHSKESSEGQWAEKAYDFNNSRRNDEQNKITVESSAFPHVSSPRSLPSWSFAFPCTCLPSIKRKHQGASDNDNNRKINECIGKMEKVPSQGHEPKGFVMESETPIQLCVRLPDRKRTCESNGVRSQRKNGKWYKIWKSLDREGASSKILDQNKDESKIKWDKENVEEEEMACLDSAQTVVTGKRSTLAETKICLTKEKNNDRDGIKFQQETIHSSDPSSSSSSSSHPTSSSTSTSSSTPTLSRTCQDGNNISHGNAKSGAVDENNQSDIGNENDSYSDLQCQGQNFDGRNKVLKMNEDSDCEKEWDDRDRKQPSDGFPSNPALPSSIVCSSSKKQDEIDSNNRSASSHLTQCKDQASHIKSKNVIGNGEIERRQDSKRAIRNVPPASTSPSSPSRVCPSSTEQVGLVSNHRSTLGFLAQAAADASQVVSNQGIEDKNEDGVNKPASKDSGVEEKNHEGRVHSLNGVSLINDDQGRDIDGECDRCKYVENTCDENRSSLCVQDVHVNTKQVENSLTDCLHPVAECHMKFSETACKLFCLWVIFCCLLFSMFLFQFNPTNMNSIKSLTSDTIDKSTSAMDDSQMIRELALKFDPNFSNNGNKKKKSEENGNPLIGFPSRHESHDQPQMDESVLAIGDSHEKRELAIYNDPSYSDSGINVKKLEDRLHRLDGNPLRHGRQVQWQIFTFYNIGKSVPTIDDLHKQRTIALKFYPNFSNGGDNEKKWEENLNPFIGDPSRHGSQVKWEIVTTNTIDEFVSHKKQKLALYNDPSYSNSGVKKEKHDFNGNPLNNGNQVLWQIINVDTVDKSILALDNLHKHKALASNNDPIYSSGGSGKKNLEENLQPFTGNPLHHGSQVEQQKVKSDTKSSCAIDVLHKKIETDSDNDPTYPNVDVEKKNCEDNLHLSTTNQSRNGRPLQQHDGNSEKSEASEVIESYNTGMTLIRFQGMQRDISINNLHPQTNRDTQLTNASNHLCNPFLLLFLHHLLCVVSAPSEVHSLENANSLHFAVGVVQSITPDTIVKSTPSTDYLHKNFDFALSENGARIVKDGYFATNPSLRDATGLFQLEIFILKMFLGLKFYNPPETILRPFRSATLGDDCSHFVNEGIDDPLSLRVAIVTLSVALSDAAFVSKISINHVADSCAALKDFRVFGFEDDKAIGRPWELGTFQYIERSNPMTPQSYLIPASIDGKKVPRFRAISLAIDSNWGDRSTCLCFLGVHGATSSSL